MVSFEHIGRLSLMVSFDSPFSAHVPIETTPIVSLEGERRWYKHDTELKIQQIYIRLYLKFYKPSLNKYIIYKLYNTEVRVQLEERGLQLPKACPREIPN